LRTGYDEKYGRGLLAVLGATYHSREKKAKSGGTGGDMAEKLTPDL